ncbi:MAG: hypothetical protein GY716_03395 [bacterium]|nr:hypothetical protein [bacterium]
MKPSRTAPAAFALYFGLLAIPIAALLLAFHVDDLAARRFLELPLALCVIPGIPVAVALAVRRRRYDVWIAQLTLGCLALFLVALAARMSSDFRDTILDDSRLAWGTFAVAAVAALAYSAALLIRRHHRGTAAAGAGIVVLALLLVSLQGRMQGYRASMQEDAWAEWATTFLFLGAGVVFLRNAWRVRRSRIAGPLRLAGLVAVVALCLVIAGEELSWGQRLIGFRPPELFLEQNYQQELNVHNFFRKRTLGGIPLDTKHQVAFLAIGYGVFAPLAGMAMAGIRSRLRTASSLHVPNAYLVPWFAAVALAEFDYPVTFTGESAELMLGAALLVDGLLLADLRSVRASARTVAAPAVAVGLAWLLAVPTPPLVERLVYGSAEQTAARTRAELETLRDDLSAPGVLSPSLLKRKVHKRVFTAIRSDYLDLGSGSAFLEQRPTPADEDAADPRRDRRGYFLDPWNNAYWIYHWRRGNHVVLYSFGPNRRRDTRFVGLSEEEWANAELSGDDIGVALTLRPPQGVGAP